MATRPIRNNHFAARQSGALVTMTSESSGAAHARRPDKRDDDFLLFCLGHDRLAETPLPAAGRDAAASATLTPIIGLCRASAQRNLAESSFSLAASRGRQSEWMRVQMQQIAVGGEVGLVARTNWNQMSQFRSCRRFRWSLVARRFVSVRSIFGRSSVCGLAFWSSPYFEGKRRRRRRRKARGI